MPSPAVRAAVRRSRFARGVQVLAGPAQRAQFGARARLVRAGAAVHAALRLARPGLHAAALSRAAWRALARRRHPQARLERPRWAEGAVGCPFEHLVRAGGALRAVALPGTRLVRAGRAGRAVGAGYELRARSAEGAGGRGPARLIGPCSAGDAVREACAGLVAAGTARGAVLGIQHAGSALIGPGRAECPVGGRDHAHSGLKSAWIANAAVTSIGHGRATLIMTSGAHDAIGSAVLPSESEYFSALQPTHEVDASA